MDNNIAFIYMKMGVADKSIARLELCLQMIAQERNKQGESHRGQSVRPDFFDIRCEKIKYKKIKSRLNLSLCILLSEKMQ